MTTLTIVKHPVIPPIKGDKDIRTALDNIRAHFESMNKAGGSVSVQDLINAGIVANVNGQLVKQ